MWFRSLTGLDEASPEQVRENITINGDELVSAVNGKRFRFGELEVLSLKELRHRVQSAMSVPKPNTIREVVANVQDLHCDESKAGALFQVASQFNLLEMISPNVSPEEGISIYESDRTQGPACAIACGAGTIYRNYFVPINEKIGQTENNQIDCLAALSKELGNQNGELWTMRNGYALATAKGLQKISTRLENANENELDRLRQLLQVGVQWGSQVTLKACEHSVSQVYCSALPVAYSRYSPSLWESFACLILEAAYEATICAAILNSHKTSSQQLYLTLLGGGAFGNKTDWIISGLQRALAMYPDFGLDIQIVSYGSANPVVQSVCSEFYRNCSSYIQSARHE